MNRKIQSLAETNYRLRRPGSQDPVLSIVFMGVPQESD